MRIVVGVSGGIAAYKTVSLVRLLVQAGHDVHVIPTAAALRFVGLPTWEAISRNPVHTDVFADVSEVRHVAYGQQADLVIVAPATANTLAKMTAGIADDLLGTTLLATKAPVLVAPAMHTEMWEHPATRDNVAILGSRGVNIIGPGVGQLTGKDSGVGRMSEPEEIAAAAAELLAEVQAEREKQNAQEESVDSELADVPACVPMVGAETAAEMHPVPARFAAEAEPAETAVYTQQPAYPQDLADVHVLVTAGGTREAIDPVRFLGNRSSGKQGVAIALAAQQRGAKVVLLAANVSDSVLAPVRDLPGLRVAKVQDTAGLRNAAHSAAAGAEVVIMVAAVSDYRMANVHEQKLRKEENEGGELVLRLVQNPDVLRELCEARRPEQVIVGFAAETVTGSDPAAVRTELLARGRAKIARKGADLLAVNAVSDAAGFETDDNRLLVLAQGGNMLLDAAGTKQEVAHRLLDAVVQELGSR